MSRTARAAGIGRSLRIYHGGDARRARMDAFYARWLCPGSLAFDIGAHVGDRTSAFRRLGARVVAAEPQPAALRALRLIHGRDPGVVLVPAALGARQGRATLHLNTANPTVSTLCGDFVAAAGAAAGWDGERWDRASDVPVTTLDALVAAHGVPDFTKIDVEGMEHAVLAGLSHPIPALSFEFTTIRRSAALAALTRLDTLAPYRFAVSLGEGFDLPADWISADEVAAHVESLPDAANSGDVYALRRDVELVPATDVA